MENKILGIHHITAIAGNAKRNYDFYTQVLGLRMVKKTVNFDDPGTYHFYFGDETGSPGSILTFFPWENISPGRQGTGMATEIGYSVPADSFQFWKDRFAKAGVRVVGEGERFGEAYLTFLDPDGLPLSLVVAKRNDERTGWASDEVGAAHATKGFHSVTLNLRDRKPTEKVLVDIFDYALDGAEGNRFRYITNAIGTANVIDVIESPSGPSAVNAGGTIHHVAFRVKDEETQANFREKILSKGYSITPKIDRNYFYSLYFREPGGVLFEIATDNPGFAADEPVSELGKSLKLPPQYEPHREKIEKILPVLS